MIELIVFEEHYNDSKEKSIQIIEFFGKKNDWDCRSEKFLAWTKCKVYKKFLTGKEDQVEFNKVPSQDEYDLAVAGNSQ